MVVLGYADDDVCRPLLYEVCDAKAPVLMMLRLIACILRRECVPRRAVIAQN